jgi:hypothetical protein
LLTYGARETVRGKGLRLSAKSGLNPSQISGVKRKGLPARRGIRDVEEKTAEKIGEQMESKVAKSRGDAILE